VDECQQDDPQKHHVSRGQLQNFRSCVEAFHVRDGRRLRMMDRMVGKDVYILFEATDW
jgi:hypothetical protein